MEEEEQYPSCAESVRIGRRVNPVEHDRSCLRMDQEEGILEDDLDSSRRKLAVQAQSRMKLP